MSGDPFGPEWQAGFIGWKATQSTRNARLAQTRVGVIILGPGKGSDEYDKRLKIRQHLEQNPYNDVAFPEELVPSPTRGQNPEILREQAYYIEQANVVIALTVANPHVTGVLAELTNYRIMLPTFQYKAWIIMPRGGGKDKTRAQYKGLIQSELAAFPASNRLLYNNDELADCTKIRAFAEKQVRIARSSIFNDSVIQAARAK